MRYNEARIATTTEIVHTRNVTLPLITVCFANYTNNRMYEEKDVAALEPGFDQSSLIKSFQLLEA